MCYLSFVTQSLPASHLVSLTELKTEVHQVLHPDEAVSILVTDVENLLEPPQKLYELFLFGKGTSFHYTGFALHTHTAYILVFLNQTDCKTPTPTVAITIPAFSSAGPTGTATVIQAARHAQEARWVSEIRDDLRVRHEALRHRPVANS